MTKVAVVGSGGWGKNHVRVFHQLGVLWGVAELDEKRRAEQAALYPEIQLVENVQDVIDAGQVDAVVVATPAGAHYEIAKQALLAGLHVFVEKPLTLDVTQAEELVTLAKEKDRILMVGHLLLYHAAVERMKALLDEGELGDLYYMYGQRINLGKVRRDENALWSLAPHDISIALRMFGKPPVKVAAVGSAYIQKDKNIEDVVFLTMFFDDGKIANFQLSWLDPHKTRCMTLVGSKKMLVFDDMEAVDKVKLFDKGVQPGDHGPDMQAIPVRSGETLAVELPAAEPLKQEALHFLDCIQNGSQPLSDGQNGLDVLKVLAAAQRSLQANGLPMELD